MSFVFSQEIDAKLSQELRSLLHDNQVQLEAAKWLADNSITKVQAFADLSSDRAGVIQNIARPAGLEHTNVVVCQPLVTAWRNAEAIAKAEIEAKAKGQEQELQTTFALGPEDRIKVDEACSNHYKFMWPDVLQPDDTALGRMNRFFNKKFRWVPRVAEIRNILEKSENSGNILVKFSTTGKAASVANLEQEAAVIGIWQFKHRHMLCMIAYVNGDSPNFARADLTTMLDNHEYVMEKALELSNTKRRPPLQKIIAADFAMRTKWMLSYVRGEFATLTETVKYHRSHSSYLFNDLHQAGSAVKTEDAEDSGTTVAEPPKKKQRGNWQEPGGNRTDKRQGALEEYALNGKRLCTFYNTIGCRKGESCSFAHFCNQSGCSKKHPRTQNHTR